MNKFVNQEIEDKHFFKKYIEEKQQEIIEVNVIGLWIKFLGGIDTFFLYFKTFIYCSLLKKNLFGFRGGKAGFCVREVLYTNDF